MMKKGAFKEEAIVSEDLIARTDPATLYSKYQNLCVGIADKQTLFADKNIRNSNMFFDEKILGFCNYMISGFLGIESAVHLFQAHRRNLEIENSAQVNTCMEHVLNSYQLFKAVGLKASKKTKQDRNSLLKEMIPYLLNSLQIYPASEAILAIEEPIDCFFDEINVF